MYTLVQNNADVNSVSLEAQGSLLAVAAQSNAKTAPIGGRRGIVADFSAASRRRMLRTLARLEQSKTTFITLTYPDNMLDDAQAYAHLRVLFERFRRRWPGCSAIWRKEYQGRGAIHFHLLVFNVPFYHFNKLRSEWAEIIGHNFPAPLFVRIESIRTKRGAMFYVAKYMSKQRGSESSALLDYVAYPHAAGPTDPWAQFRPPLQEAQKQSTGRHWGIFNRGKLPYAPRQCLTVRVATWRSFHDVKRIFRRQWRFMNKDRQKGGVIFSERAYGLWAASLRLLLNDIHDEWFAPNLISIGA